MKHLFLPYNLCQISKQKGFKDICLAVYVPLTDGSAEFEIGLSDANKKGRSLISSPTYDQIINWFIEKHEIHPCYGSNHSGWYWEITKTNGTTIKYQSDVHFFKTHYEALNKAIEEAFKLI